jgi:hypothetical protein
LNRRIREIPEACLQGREIPETQEPDRPPKIAAVEEMEKLMLTNTAIQEKTYRPRPRRSPRVMQALVRSGQVEAGRLFIVDPRSILHRKKEKLKTAGWN